MYPLSYVLKYHRMLLIRQVTYEIYITTNDNSYIITCYPSVAFDVILNFCRAFQILNLLDEAL